MEERIEFFKDARGYVRFYLVVDKIESHCVDASVFEVSGWYVNEGNRYDDGELYLNVCLKWDGCSHVTFSENGYKHFCGKTVWKEHGAMMMALYERLAPMIADYDSDIAED